MWENTQLGKKNFDGRQLICRKAAAFSTCSSQEKRLSVAPKQIFLPLHCEHKKSQSCVCSWFARTLLPEFNERVLGRIRHFTQFGTWKQGSQGVERSSAHSHWCQPRTAEGAFHGRNDSRILHTILRMKQCMDILRAHIMTQIKWHKILFKREINIVFVLQILSNRLVK